MGGSRARRGRGTAARGRSTKQRLASVRPRLLLGSIRSVKRCASILDRIYPFDSGIVLLIYHRIGTAKNEITLPPPLFERQMEWLAASGRVISLASALGLLVREDPLREQGIVVTFDDGSAD